MRKYLVTIKPKSNYDFMKSCAIVTEASSVKAALEKTDFTGIVLEYYQTAKASILELDKQYNI